MLKIEAKQDLKLDENGWCRMFIEGLSFTAAEPVELSIKRAGAATPYLGERGWQASETWLLFDDTALEGETLVLRVGPRHTLPLSEVTTVEIRVRMLGEAARPENRSRLAWPRIVLPVTNPFQDEEPVAAPPPPPPPEPEPESEPEPEPEAELAEEPLPEATPVADEAAQPEPERSKKLWLILALGLIAAVVVTGLVAFLADEDPPLEEPIAEVEPVAPPPPPQDRTYDEAQVRSFLAAEPNPSDTLAEAEAYLEAGHPDLALLLYRNADRQGQAAASVAIGRMYDPSTFDSQTSAFPSPNADQAATYYLKAAETGDAEAQFLLGKLMVEGATSGPGDAEAGVVWLQRAAEQGNEDAKQMLATLN